MPVLLVHGNVASSLFFEETLAALPPYYLGLAPDLRGFGRFQPPFRLVREPAGDPDLRDTKDEGRRLQLPRGQVTLIELAEYGTGTMGKLAARDQREGAGGVGRS